MQKVFMVLTTESFDDISEIVVPYVFKTLETAKVYVGECIRSLTNVHKLPRDHHSTYEWKEGRMMGVGTQWGIIYNGTITFWIYEVTVQESGLSQTWTC